MVNLSFVRGIVFFKQKTAYEVRISDRSSDVCSSDLTADVGQSLSADAAFRVTGVYEDSGSYRDGVTVRREGINTTLLFTAGDATRITVGYEYFHDDRPHARRNPSHPLAFEGPPYPVETSRTAFFGAPGGAPP